jgi:hypothetical protein
LIQHSHNLNSSAIEEKCETKLTNYKTSERERKKASIFRADNQTKKGKSEQQQQQQQPRMLPKQTEFASNPLLNKQTKQANQKRRRWQYFFCLSGLSNTKSNPCNNVYFFLPLLQISSKFTSFGIEHRTTTFFLSVHESCDGGGGGDDHEDCIIFLAAKTMIVRKGDKEGELRESRQERDKSVRETGVNKRQYG